MASGWHILHDGHWTETVRYLGAAKWHFRSVDDLSSTTLKETFSTKRLIEWVIDRDGDDGDHSNQEMDPAAESDDTGEHRPLGPRGMRLLEIAQSVGAGLCSRRLRGINEGKWPPAPKVTAITGIARRAVWRGVFHTVYTAQTSKGAAYVYPPQLNNTSRLVLAGSPSSDQGWIVRLSAKSLREMKQYEAQLGHAARR